MPSVAMHKDAAYLAVSSRTNVASTNPKHHGPRPRFRRYYLRALIGMAGPIVITSFFLSIWAVYLRPLDQESTFVVGPSGATQVYYAWFIVSVLGLNLSLYGLNAAESGMLLSEPRGGGVPEALLRHDRHVGGTWSGPGGWAKMARRVTAAVRYGSWRSVPPSSPVLPWRRWVCLALPSALVFIALPLSGLTFEPDSGFVRSLDEGRAPNITGFSYADFNERQSRQDEEGARAMWRNAMNARVPGMGIVYTRPGDDRLPPGALPRDAGVPGVFLTAQAETPIDGTSWGLALQYNCTIIENVSDLTLLRRRRREDDQVDSSNGYDGLRPLFEVPGNADDIVLGNQTWGLTDNLSGVVEYGVKSWPVTADGVTGDQLTDELRRDPNKTTACYFNQLLNVTGDYHDADQESVLELILWQHLMPHHVYPQPAYNLTIDHNMTDLYGAYGVVEAEGAAGRLDLLQEVNVSTTDGSSPMTAIGVRCASSAAVGTAIVDGVRSTFTDFTRTDTSIPNPAGRCAPRLHAQTVVSLLDINLYSITRLRGIDPGRNPDPLGDLFESIAAPPRFSGTTGADSPGEIQSAPVTVRQAYLQASDLRSSLLRAYAAYAVQLMYAGDKGPTLLDGAQTVSHNPNVTAFVPGRVLKYGDVPVFLPMTLLIVWMVTSVSLCALFGFRPRWSDTVDEGVRAFRGGSQEMTTFTDPSIRAT